MTFPEIVVVVALMGIAAGIAAGPLAEGLGRARLATAARELGRRMVHARWQAVTEGRNIGLRFEARGDRWGVSTYVDGDGDGIRSDDIERGRDAPLTRWVEPGEGRGGVRLGIPEGRFPRIPPSSGWLQGGEDPIRFGRSNIVSFSPLGDATPGTAYLTDGQGRLAAVVVFGATSRVRVLRFDRDSGSWR